MRSRSIRNAALAACLAACLCVVLLFGILNAKAAIRTPVGLDQRTSERIDALERYVRELDERFDAMLEKTQAMPTGPAPVIAPAVPVAQRAADGAAGDLAAILGGDARDRLRAMILEVVEETRADRLRAERRDMAKRSQALVRLRKGPYGRDNYEVNGVGDALGLSDAQKTWYHELFRDYSERLDDLRSSLSTDDASRGDYVRGRASLQREFEAAVGANLTQDQSIEFASLPAWLGTIRPVAREAVAPSP